MRRAGRRDLPPPAITRIDRQAPLHGPVGCRGDAGFSSTRREPSLLTGSIIRAATRSRNTSSPLAAWSKPRTRQARSSASSRKSIRDAVIGSGPPPAPSEPDRSAPVPGPARPGRPQALPCNRLQQLQLRIVMSRADVLDVPRPAGGRSTRSAPPSRPTASSRSAHRAPGQPTARISAQLQPSSITKAQVSAIRRRSEPKRGPTRGR